MQPHDSIPLNMTNHLTSSTPERWQSAPLPPNTTLCCVPSVCIYVLERKESPPSELQKTELTPNSLPCRHSHTEDALLQGLASATTSCCKNSASAPATTCQQQTLPHPTFSRCSVDSNAQQPRPNLLKPSGKRLLPYAATHCVLLPTIIL